MEFTETAAFISTLSDDIVISILPEHSRRIFTNEKQYELRKAIPKVIPRRIFLYETDGSQRISGHIIIERVISGAPDYVWEQTGEKGTTKERFYNYFKNTPIAYAYEISHAVQYSEPLHLAELKIIEPDYRPPQNFIYLENLKKLRVELRKRCFNEAMNIELGGVRLVSFDDNHFDFFSDLVEKHVGLSYLETGKTYAEKIYQLSKESEDSEGIFTSNKKLFEIIVNGNIAGFIVLTEKIGGSIKTGPVILLEDFRSQGYGQQLRQVIHSIAGAAGFRKIYCTVPANNFSAVNYLISSSYRLEAHLSRHYHYCHDEFVFGFNVAKYRGPGQIFDRHQLPISVMEVIKKSENETISFVQKEFSSYISEVNSSWALRQVDSAVAHIQDKENKFKSRVMFCGSYLERVAVAIAVLKRGGSVKLIILTKTAHQKSLVTFISYLENELSQANGIKIRKFYSHVPASDVDVVQAFYSSGYRVEGILETPYNQCCDMMVLAKVTQHHQESELYV